VVAETCIFFHPQFKLKSRIGTQDKRLIEMSCFILAWCRKIMSMPVLSEQIYDAKDK
jgi:hypothetical protein